MTLGRFCRIDLGRVLVADVAHAAVAADHPDLGQLDDLLIGHERIGEVRVVVVLLFGDDVPSRVSSMSARRSGMTERRAWSTMKLSPMSQPTVTPSWKSEFIHG